jgi:hypothetical protein
VRDIDYLVWEMPVTQTVQLVHYRLRSDGAWTVEREPSIAPQVAIILAAPSAEIQW